MREHPVRFKDPHLDFGFTCLQSYGGNLLGNTPGYTPTVSMSHLGFVDDGGREGTLSGNLTSPFFFCMSCFYPSDVLRRSRLSPTEVTSPS